MRRKARRSTSRTVQVAALAAAIALVGVAAVVRWTASPPEQPIAAPAPAGNPIRVNFPPGHRLTFTLPDGQVRTVRSLLNVTRRMHYGDYAWNDAGVPAGPAWVRVDLARQTISVFRAEREVGTAVILFGTDDKPTPTGVFPILERAEDHWSTLYDAEMPYMLRLTPDGVAIHATSVRQGSATHGCIGIPLGFARRLFEEVRRGDVVVIDPGTP